MAFDKTQPIPSTYNKIRCHSPGGRVSVSISLKCFVCKRNNACVRVNERAYRRYWLVCMYTWDSCRQKQVLLGPSTRNETAVKLFDQLQTCFQHLLWGGITSWEFIIHRKASSSMSYFPPIKREGLMADFAVRHRTKMASITSFLTGCDEIESQWGHAFGNMATIE